MREKEVSKNETRNSFLDITRIFAVLMVVLTHVSAQFVDGNESNTIAFFVGNVFDSLSRIGVPLFLMISGALLLREEKSVTGKSIYKRIKNIALLLIFWSGGYALCYSITLPLLKGESIILKNFLYHFIMGHYHLWYLYMIIGVYAITPFLRSFVKKENKNLVLIFLLFSILAQFFPAFLSIFCVYCKELKYIVNFIEKFNLDFFGGYTAYYIFGWYIAHIGFEKKERIVIYILSILSFIGIVLVGQFVPNSTGTGTAYGLAYSNTGLLVLLYATGVFTLLSHLKSESMSQLIKKLSKRLAELSFGVYVVHVVILLIIRKIFTFVSIPIVYILTVWIMTTGVSFCICYMVSKIPILKKLIRT